MTTGLTRTATWLDLIRSGFHRIDTLTRQWSRARSSPWIKIQRLRGVDSGSTGVKLTGARRSTAALSYCTLQIEPGSGVAHQTHTTTRRSRGSGQVVEARRSPAGIPRRSCCCGSGSSEKTNAAPAGHARKRASVRRCTTMRGEDLRKSEAQRLTGAREIDSRRRR